MKWYWHIGGGHTHVRVFMNGAKCGDLCFRNEEFVQVREHCPWIAFRAGGMNMPKTTLTKAPCVYEGCKQPAVEQVTRAFKRGRYTAPAKYSLCAEHAKLYRTIIAASKREEPKPSV